MEDSLEDFSRLALSHIPTSSKEDENGSSQTANLILHHNNIAELPQWFPNYYRAVTRLDLSKNTLNCVPQEVLLMSNLKYLLLKNNDISMNGLPKDWIYLRESLHGINLSGNPLDTVPDVLCDQLLQLRFLYLGGCQIRTVPRKICQLNNLELLYLGGNSLREVPAELGLLASLTCLVLSDNRLESLPSTLNQLTHLESLSLHNNRLQKLPPEIVSLNNLSMLSLRQNPLVVKFVRLGLQQWSVPSLLELAGRSVYSNTLPYDRSILPHDLVDYLNSAHHCVNPDCQGVYFSSRVEHVKFVDFCGKYRLPLMQFLCSPSCSADAECSGTESSSTSDEEADHRMRRVLLG